MVKTTTANGTSTVLHGSVAVAPLKHAQAHRYRLPPGPVLHGSDAVAVLKQPVGLHKVAHGDSFPRLQHRGRIEAR
jgi:hypothetical protein